MSTEFPMNAKVRFTQERLSILTARDRQGLAGRIGVVQTDGKLIRKPTVYFPTDGTKPELRLFAVDPRQLELVEAPPATEPEPESAPRLNDGANPTDPSNLTPGTAGGEASASEGGGTLSQDELDNFFD
jgi:hypothetical protein